MRIRIDPVLHINDTSAYNVLEYHRGKKVQRDISYFSRSQEIGLKPLFISELSSFTFQCLLPFWGRIYMIKIYPLLGKTTRTTLALLLLCSTEFLTVQWYWPSWVTACCGWILSKRKGNWSCYPFFWNWGHAVICSHTGDEDVQCSLMILRALESYFSAKQLLQLITF